jgi:predicted nicotinamide N-methyase
VKTPPQDLISVEVALPGGAIRLRQPSDFAQLPDDGDVKWAPIAPYWAVLWRSGVALARQLAERQLEGMRIVELGCGLGLPSLVAARGGASVLAVDAEREALDLLEQNARLNRVALETLRADWTRPQPILDRGPFDLALGADVLYEESAPAHLASLLPRLAARALIADPGRPGAGELLELLELAPVAPPRVDGVVTTYELSAPR